MRRSRLSGCHGRFDAAGRSMYSARSFIWLALGQCHLWLGSVLDALRFFTLLAADRCGCLRLRRASPLSIKGLIMSFSDLGLLPELMRAVADKGYDTPSPIQIQAIPAVLAGRDVLAGARTGDRTSARL